MSLSRRRAVTAFAAAALLLPLAGPPAAAQPDDPDDAVHVSSTATLRPYAAVDGDFEKIQLTEDVGEPMALAVAPDGRVLMTDRRGTIKIFDPNSYNVTTAGHIEVYAGEEDGLQGIALDPDFEDNGWVYTYYAPPDPQPRNVLSRFQLDGNTLDLASEQVILEVPTQRDLCCHVGGDIDFDAEGNLYLSTGDNTNSWASDGYTPIDEREGREPFDAQRSSGNTNDLRGKLLRITVQDDGGYTIPEGNLFEEGTEGTRPEIYYMGLRNPFRFSVDQETGRIFLGVVGPDARDAHPERGPEAFDEVYLMDGPGNGGWPYCMGNNTPYVDYDFTNGQSGETFDCANLVNDSPNNTGLAELPPATAADVWYSYGCSDEFPELPCEGGNTAMGGPVYRYDPDLESNTKFPESFDGAHFFYEYSRNFVADVRFDESGEYESMTPFLEELDFNQPMDMEFGPEGSLYVLEYGGGFFTPGTYAGLYRIDHTQGVQSPAVELSVDQTSGEAPLPVSFDATGSTDPNGGDLTFAWDFEGDGVDDAEGPTARHTYTENGIYHAKLTATNTAGRETVQRVTITIGNNAPDIRFSTPPDGSMFDWEDQIAYRVEVDDVEDGSIGDGISCTEVTTQTALGHDTHAHPQDNFQSCQGVFSPEAGSHSGDANLFWVARTSYSDRGSEGVGSTTSEQEIILQPKTKQAQHFSSAEGISVADREGAEGGQVVTEIDPGDWISYRPMNLFNIDGVNLRIATGDAEGAVELRVGAPDGELVATLPVPSGDGEFVDLDPVELTDPGGTHELFLVFTGAGSNLFDLDHISFQGLGAAGPRHVEAVGDVDRGPAPLDVAFTAEGEALPEGSTFEWDFGDGATASGEAVDHTYTETGEHTATVTVTDPDGVVRATDAVEVTVHDPVTGTLTVDPAEAELTTDGSHTVTATVSEEARDAEVTLEVYRRSPASPLPPGQDEGVPHLLVERTVGTPDEDGAVTLDYASTVTSQERVVACLGYGGGCVRGGDTLVTGGADGTDILNLRTDLSTATATASWQVVADEDGFLNLYDGKSLAGWEQLGGGGFTVDEDGTLRPHGPRGILWYAEREFDDYVLEAEYETYSVSANSGLYQRFPDPQGDLSVPSDQGYEVAILDRVDDAINRTGSINGYMAAKYLTAKPPYGGWNTFEIEVVGQQYTVTLNDRIVTEYTGDGSRGLRGHIGVENADSQLRFRNLRIKPLGEDEQPPGAPAVTAALDPAEPNGDPHGDWEGTYHSPVTATLAVEEDGGDAEIEYRWGDGDWSTYSEPLTRDEEGEHVLGYRSRTAEGSVSEEARLSFVIRHDACPGSDLRETVHAGQDSGVPNRVRDDGCTVNDLVDEAREWSGHAVFVAHVRQLTSDLAAEGLLSTAERARVIHAAASSDIGRRD
ncbi:PQQ-dependent sugar dehydrogenase [Actinoalloteichus spitiensis]|uniref:PQQ-dependent sugar dehydrogenase n=1 Tax=Actinoalloteichus spitiensis TaxID=252394 RepID=UPI0012F64DE5|nr:PQQ-dependent sugar dehydrogenase [Actinoalloteichus spitiensis]